MSYTADIADAVVEAINAAGVLPSSVEAERVYVPSRDYAEFVGETCIVFPSAIMRERETRTAIRKTIDIDVVYAAKLVAATDATDGAGNTVIDGYLAIGEGLADAIQTGAEYAGARCVGVEADPVYDFELLRSHRVFVTRLRASFLLI